MILLFLDAFAGCGWGTFLSWLFIIDIVVLAIGFVLNKVLWTKESGLTKNDRRNLREDDVEEEIDYRRLSDSASDYNEVKTIDEESFDEDYTMPIKVDTQATDIVDTLYGDVNEDGNANTNVSPINDKVEQGDSFLDFSKTEDGYDETVSDEDVEKNNDLAQARYMDDLECDAMSSEDFDMDVNGVNYLLEEEDEAIHFPERMQDVENVSVSHDESFSTEGNVETENFKINESDEIDLGLAYPKNIKDELQNDVPSMDEIEDSDFEPNFEE